MGKRSDFERHERDLYLTPVEAVLPLKRFVRPGSRFWEPCAAGGGLARALVEQTGLECIGMSDIVPLHPSVERYDLFQIATGATADQFITNPPWERKILHRIIDHLKWILPTWLLLDADWLFNKSSAEYLPDATDIVAIGRVKWVPDSEHTGKENACWVRFVGGHDRGATFHPNW